jgi:protein TonB
MDVRAYLRERPVADELGSPARRFARRGYQRRLAIAILAAGSLHLGAMITGIVIRALALRDADEEAHPPTVTLIFDIPPAIAAREPEPPRFTPKSPPPRVPPIGIPIPVADAPRYDTIADQEQMDVATFEGVSGLGDSVGGGSWGVPGGVGTGWLEPSPVPEFIEVAEVPPEPVERPSPIYPELARLSGIEGRVIVRVTVGVTGKVEEATVVAGAHELLDEAALAAARQWVFVPARQQSVPVATWVHIPFRFSLR